jgi:serine/threonine protein kinase
MELEIGSTVGDYEVVGVLGAGGMGKVYKVRNVISDRFEAMKVLLADLEHAPELADRFMREIKVHASLEHPNIAALRTAMRVENQLLMVMELVDGVTLQQKLQPGPLPAASAVDYIMQVLSALEYAHGRGVVHRDVKPANMMLTSAGVVKLLDFGIAKATSDHGLTMTGTTLGSLYYMSPEQIQGVATLDGRTDLYSVGVSLYELVTGKRPFDGDSQYAIMAAHLERNPPPPVEVDPRLPQALSDVILMSVARSPDARFQSAAAFRNALGSETGAAAPAAQPAAAVPPARPSPMGTPITPPAATEPRHRRGLWMALGAVAMAAAAIAMIQFGPWRGSKAAPSIPAASGGTAATPVTPPAAPPPAAPPAPEVAPSTPQPPATLPAPQISKPKPINTTAQKATATPSQPAPQTPAPAPAVPQSTPAIPAAPPAAQTPSSPPPSAPPPASRAELQEARERLVQLGARGNGIHASLQTLQRAQAASGLNLRGDMVEAASLMDSYLQGANAALNAGDAASAKSLLEKAELQIERLEKFLNR